MVRFQSQMGRREAKGEGNLERSERFHLAVEPVRGVWPERVGPAQPGAEICNVVLLHPRNRSFKPRILKMKPLTKANTPVRWKIFCRQLWHTVTLEQA